MARKRVDVSGYGRVVSGVPESVRSYSRIQNVRADIAGKPSMLALHRPKRLFMAGGQYHSPGEGAYHLYFDYYNAESESDAMNKFIQEWGPVEVREWPSADKLEAHAIGQQHEENVRDFIARNFSPGQSVDSYLDREIHHKELK